MAVGSRGSTLRVDVDPQDSGSKHLSIELEVLSDYKSAIIAAVEILSLYDSELEDVFDLSRVGHEYYPNLGRFYVPANPQASQAIYVRNNILMKLVPTILCKAQ